MIKHTNHRMFWPCPAALLVIAVSVAAADEPRQTIPDPGYRPDSYWASDFVEALDEATVAILPTIVRRSERSAHSFASQQQIVAYLNDMGIEARARPKRVDLGPVRRPSQWQIFEYGAENFGEAIRKYDTGTDYALVMEILVPDSQKVFGIEVYIVDREGRHVLSFVLNEHHEIFAKARLMARNSSEAAREEMIAKATTVGLTAFEIQTRQLRECVTESAPGHSISRAGTLHDFQSPLALSRDSEGLAPGFLTFGDGRSEMKIARTGDFPQRSGSGAGNQALRLDANVNGWAGFVELFSDDDMEQWIPRDWSHLEGLSFWLYGNNSGTDMYVDILDNRHPCSTRDDAERYTYRFVDDVAGWRLIAIPFSDMARNDIGNGAPNDGLGLNEVHGWAIGILETGEPLVFYVDDVRLEDQAGGAEDQFRNATSHRLFLEAPIDETSSRILIHARSMQGLVIEKVMALTCDISRLTKARGYVYSRIDERAKLSGDRAVFRVTFYLEPPEQVPVLRAQPDPDTMSEQDMMSAAIEAEALIKVCELVEANAS